MNLSDIKDCFDIVQKAFTIAGLCVGGVWAYYKFIRGRVFTSRLEPTVSARAFADEKNTVLIATVSLKNVGLSKVLHFLKTSEPMPPAS
jgi:hypothetical protein